jgi:hypothetical protein
MTENTTPDQRPALRSLTLRGALAMAIAYGLQQLGVDLPAGAPQSIADALADLAFYGGLIAVGVGRARARHPLS